MKHAIHTAYISPKILLGKNNHQTMRYWGECMPLINFFRGYHLLLTTFAWRSSTTGGTIFTLFFVSKRFSLFLVHPPSLPYKKSQTKSVLCVIEHRCVCSYSRLYHLHEYKLCLFARTCIIPPSRSRGRSHWQCCCLSFGDPL